MKVLILLLAFSPAGDFVALYFADHSECEVTRTSILRVMPYVSQCTKVEVEQGSWVPPTLPSPQP